MVNLSHPFKHQQQFNFLYSSIFFHLVYIPDMILDICEKIKETNKYMNAYPQKGPIHYCTSNEIVKQLLYFELTEPVFERKQRSFYKNVR